MALKIIAPSEGDRFFVGKPVEFKGTADGEIVSIKLFADQFLLTQVNVKDGNWTAKYQFNTAGNPRTLSVQGLDSTGQLLDKVAINLVIQSNVKSLDNRQQFFQIGEKVVWKFPGQTAFFYKTDMQIDADGAVDAYHPEDEGIDYLGNAGTPGNWWALVTDNGESDGEPIIQGKTDPRPGYYVSTTSLEDTSKIRTDPRRYVDSSSIPYIVLPGRQTTWDTGVKLGDFVAVYNGSNGKLSLGIFADTGPREKLGEGSVALARALGHEPVIRGKIRAGIDEDLLYVVFPGSRKKPWRSEETLEQLKAEATKSFEVWGGLEQIKACYQGL